MQALAEQLTCDVTKMAQVWQVLSASCAAGGHRVVQAVCGGGAATPRLDTLPLSNDWGQGEAALLTAVLACIATLIAPVP